MGTLQLPRTWLKRIVSMHTTWRFEKLFKISWNWTLPSLRFLHEFKFLLLLQRPDSLSKEACAKLEEDNRRHQVFYLKCPLCESLNSRNLHCSNGKEKLRKSWRQRSGQWHHWFMASCMGSFSEHLSPSLFFLCSVRTGSLLWRLITDEFTLVFFPHSVLSHHCV